LASGVKSFLFRHKEHTDLLHLCIVRSMSCDKPGTHVPTFRDHTPHRTQRIQIFVSPCQ
jgi:hypothetical protein